MVKLIDSKNKHFNLYREALKTVEKSNDGLYVYVTFKVYGDAVLAANIKNIDTLEFDFIEIDKTNNLPLNEINTFNHRQLGKSDEWLMEKIKTSSVESDYINMWNFNANSFDTILDTTKDLKDLLTLLINYNVEGLLTKLSKDSDKLNNFMDLFNKLLLQELGNIGLHTRDKLKNEVMPKLKTFDTLKEFLPLLVGNFRCTGVLPYSLAFATDIYLKSLKVTKKDDIQHIDNKETNENIVRLKEHTDMLKEFHVGDEPNFTEVMKLKRKYHNTSTDLVTELSKKTNAVNVFIFKLQYALRKECSRYNDTKTVKLVEELEKHIKNNER